MLNPAVITTFLEKPRENYEWLKECSSDELDEALQTYLPALPDLKLWHHQKVALVLLAELKRFMLFMDMGAGKTLTSLALIEALKNAQKCRSIGTRDNNGRCCAIVFVPYVTSVMTWVDECKKHTPGLRCVPLVSDTQTNEQQLYHNTTSTDLFVICYQSAVAMLCDREGTWRLDVDKVRETFRNFNILIMDEIHKCKDQSTLTYKMCLTISRQTEYALGLTGTPFGRDLQALWPQFNLIDFGETLGPTLSFYREVFFKQKKQRWGKRIAYDYTFQKRLMPNLKRIIKNRSVHYSIDELMALPEKHYIPMSIRCPEAARGYAEEAVEALRKAGKNQENAIIEGNYLRLRQLSSGFMDVGGTKVAFEDNPKLEALVDLIEAMPDDCKMVVFHHFVYTNELISKRLTKEKISHARVWGGQASNLSELERFRDDPRCRILVINTKSGSSSLNLQFANYCTYFEQPDSPIDRSQADARIYRSGQQRRVFYYDLLVEGTVDKRLHESNLAGKSLLQELLRGGKL